MEYQGPGIRMYKNDLRVMYRPKSSDAGPAITGPTANARTKTETRSERTVTLVSWNSTDTCDNAGAYH